MASKRYENNAWVDIEELKRYENGAWVDCESAKKYENGAWVEVWSKTPTLKFVKVYSTSGTTPTYTYDVASDNASFSYNIVSMADATRSELVLKIKPPATGTYSFSFTLSDKTATASSSNYGIAVGYLDSSGNISTVKRYVAPTNKTYTTTISSDLDVAYITIVIQVYGNTGVYHKGTISNIAIDGVSCQVK